MSPSSDAPINIMFELGPPILGYFLNWALLGVLTAQVYMYYLAFPNDQTYRKILVYLVYGIEAIQSILIARDAAQSYGLGFGSLEAITAVRLLWLSIPIVGGLAALIVQGFYAYRIYVLGKSRIPPVIIMIMAVIQGGFSIATAVLADKGGNLTTLDKPDVLAVQGLWTGISAGCDVFIAVCMSYLLLNNKSGYAKTQAFIIRVLRLIIGTGSFTAAVAVVNLVLFNLSKYGTSYIAPGVLLGKLYSNSMMVILISRLDIADGRHKHRLMEVHQDNTQDTVAHKNSNRIAVKSFSSESPIELQSWSPSDIENSKFHKDATQIRIGVTKQTTVLTA